MVIILMMNDRKKKFVNQALGLVLDDYEIQISGSSPYLCRTEISPLNP